MPEIEGVLSKRTMKEYILKQNGDKKELFSGDIDFTGYKFNSKRSKNIIKVSNVTVVDPKMINEILTIKFNRRFKKLLTLVSAVLNDTDASDADTALALDEVQLVKEILLNRYQKFLNQEKEELFLKKLRVLENELRLKQVMITQQNMQYYEKSELRGR